jgi:hypothetical protein
MCSEFYPEIQDNDGTDASVDFVEFDDVTPVGAPDDDEDDNDRAQGDDDVDDASSASSHVGPPAMIDSSSEDEDYPHNRRGNLWADDADDDKEIEQLIVGVIPPEDDDLGGFVKHLKEGDMDVVYSRDFVDSAVEAMSMRHLWQRVSRNYDLVIHVDVPRL